MGNGSWKDFVAVYSVMLFPGLHGCRCIFLQSYETGEGQVYLCAFGAVLFISSSINCYFTR